jgi:hypothetical protein
VRRKCYILGLLQIVSKFFFWIFVVDWIFALCLLSGLCDVFLVLFLVLWLDLDRHRH